MTKQYVTNHNFDTLWIVVIVFFALLFVLILIVDDRLDKVEKEIAPMPHYECWEEKDWTDWETCHDHCYDIAFYNLSSSCDPGIEGNCERGEVKWLRAKEDYKLCVKSKGCSNIDYEVKQVCELYKDANVLEDEQ